MFKRITSSYVSGNAWQVGKKLFEPSQVSSDLQIEIIKLVISGEAF